MSNKSYELFLRSSIILILLDLMFNLIVMIKILPLEAPTLYLFGTNSSIMASSILFGMLFMLVNDKKGDKKNV
jgi:cell division protein FtsW (lipid II flippase)